MNEGIPRILAAHGLCASNRFDVLRGALLIAQDETISIEAADAPVADMHRYMFERMGSVQPSRQFLDGYALDIYNAVFEAVEKWVKDSVKHDHFTKYHRQKIEFYHTGILSGAWLNMRKCQYVASLGASQG